MHKRVTGTTPTSEKLISYFRALGINPPPKTGGALNLKHYLEHGYKGLHGENKSDRIAIIRSLQNQLVGKKVFITSTGTIGKVAYITAISQWHIYDSIYIRRTIGHTPACLRFMIVGEDGKVIGLKIKSAFELVE